MHMRDLFTPCSKEEVCFNVYKAIFYSPLVRHVGMYHVYKRVDTDSLTSDINLKQALLKYLDGINIRIHECSNLPENQHHKTVFYHLSLRDKSFKINVYWQLTQNSSFVHERRSTRCLVYDLKKNLHTGGSTDTWWAISYLVIESSEKTPSETLIVSANDMQNGFVIQSSFFLFNYVALQT